MVLRCPTAAAEGRSASLGKSAVFKIRAGSRSRRVTEQVELHRPLRLKAALQRLRQDHERRLRLGAADVRRTGANECRLDPMPNGQSRARQHADHLRRPGRRAFSARRRIEFGDPHWRYRVRARSRDSGRRRELPSHPHLPQPRRTQILAPPPGARYPHSPNAHGALCNVFVK